MILEPQIEDLVLKYDILAISQPLYYVLNPFTGVADLLGMITIYDLGAQNPSLNEIKKFTGDGVTLDALSIGESLELRRRIEYGRLVYELFYHNWNFNQAQ